MEFDPESAGGTYTNRRDHRAMAIRRDRREAPAPRHVSSRAIDRMLLSLRAYEQRAQRRAALHAWILTRRATTATAAAGG